MSIRNNATCVRFLVFAILAAMMSLGVSSATSAAERVVHVKVRADSEHPAMEAFLAMDGDPGTFWHSMWRGAVTNLPHEIVVDLGKSREITGFTHLTRPAGCKNGNIKDYEVYLSDKPEAKKPLAKGTPVAKGTFENEVGESVVKFAAPVKGRYFRLRALSNVDAQPTWAGIAELTLHCEGVKFVAKPSLPEPLDYNQKYRPQFHFTPNRNWTNDPNGMVYYDGEYHLFFQHNPAGLNWGNMTWAHAISKDMVHWKQIQHAIRPYAGGTIFSGSAAVDWKNSTGFGKTDKGAHKPIVACYSHARVPFTQAIAYSIDRGRTWIRYKGNPVVPNQGAHASERDPKIFWHEPTKKWVMVLYLRGGLARIFNSDDLKKWVRTSDVTGRGFHECPDMFELPVDGDKKKTKWVLYDAGFLYSIGSFDGKTYKVEATPGRGDLGGNFYAAQTFNDTPDGRIMQIAWMRGSNFPRKGMPFNQQMSFPCELTLRTTDEGVRLYRWPVKEIQSIYNKKHEVKKTQLKPGDNPLKDIKAELLDLYADITMGSAKKVVFNLRGSAVTYDGRTLATPRGRGALKPRGGRITVRILVDRGSVEAFGNEGRLSLTSYAIHEPANLDLSLTVEGGDAVLNKLVVNELKSAWK